MKIAGYLRTSLIEWPGKISAVIFTPGCNFRCPFCHNRDLVDSSRVKKLPSFKEDEVLSDLESRKKWIDGVVFSIHGDEPAVVKKRGLLLHVPIREIWNWTENGEIFKKPIIHEVKKLNGIECLTKKGFKKADKIIRHKAKILYKVICGPGNYSVLTTGSHSVFTVTKNGLTTRRVDKLRRGEWLLSPRKIEPGKKVGKLSLLEYTSSLKENQKIRRERIKYWKKIVSQIGQKSISELSREYGHSRKTIREYYRSFKNGFSDLLDEWIIEDGFIRHKTSSCKIPIEIELTCELGEFLGYAVAEGSVQRKKKNISTYSFTLGDEPEFAQRILTLYRRIFSQSSGVVNKIKSVTGNWQYNVVLGNRIIGETIENLVGRGFVNKHIPQVIFNASENVKMNFLKALVLGDGHERIRKKSSQHEFSLKTGSRKLAGDIVFLLRTLEIFSWIEEEKRCFRVVVSQNDLEKLKVKSPLKLKYRFRTRVEGIPRELLGYSLRGQKRIKAEELAIWENLPMIRNKKQKAAAIRYRLINKNGKVTEKGKRMLFFLNLSKNWNFKEIKEIKKVKLDRPEYVYDLIVDDNHSFIGGIGGLLLHNSGGEPTLQSDLASFLKKVKKIGFETMIETNGSRPEVLSKILDSKFKILNSIAMDYKTSLIRYERLVGWKEKKGSLKSKITQSINLFLKSGLPFELRTTVVPTIHDEKVLVKMAQELRRLSSEIRWRLQTFRPENCLDPGFSQKRPFSRQQMANFLSAVQRIVPRAKWSGIDS